MTSDMPSYAIANRKLIFHRCEPRAQFYCSDQHVRIPPLMWTARSPASRLIFLYGPGQYYSSLILAPSSVSRHLQVAHMLGGASVASEESRSHTYCNEVKAGN